MEHAKLSASGSHRWLTCPASIKATENYKESTNDAAEWGTRCHALGEKMLKWEKWECNDTEMVETAEAYVHYCRALHGTDREALKVEMIEERFDFSHIVPGGFGTGDYAVLVSKTLHIVDLKTGYNLVYAEDNSQLKLCGIGVIKELESIYDIEKVELHIVQSRASHYSSWETTPEALQGWGQWVAARAELALTDNAPFNPEAKACKYCPHQGECLALKEHVETIVTSDFDNLEDIEGNADKVSNKAISKILANSELILGFVKAVQTIALERMNEGQDIEGFKLVAAKTNRKWGNEKEVEAKLKGKDIYVQKLKPMTKLLKEFPNDGLEELLIKPEGKPVLAPLTDKRPDINEQTCDSFDKL
jgi:hypothetical protein